MHWTKKIQFVSRDLVPSDRVTCTIASRMNFFNTKKASLSTLTSKFEIWAYYQLYNQCNQYSKAIFIWLSMHSNLYTTSTIFLWDYNGLDECRDKAIQQLNLQLLCKTITVQLVPLRFQVWIGSHPESLQSLGVVLFNPERDIQELI